MTSPNGKHKVFICHCRSENTGYQEDIAELLKYKDNDDGSLPPT